MALNRRDFLKTAAPGREGTTGTDESLTWLGRTPAPKRLLILGGTGFIGPHMVRYAVERGHEVTIFTRGQTEAQIPDVEHLLGDRNDDLRALEGRSWDVILDNNARDYRWVQLSTDVLRDSAEQYVFVSSLSAYSVQAMDLEGVEYPLTEPVVDENSPLFSPPPDFQEGQEAPYGLSKTLGERAAEAAFPGRATVVRPGLIVGPGDPTDRFTYWPVRISRGGEVLAPGTGDDTTQIIDVRDLAEWIVRLAEEGVDGRFNAAGPATRLSMAEMLLGIRAITTGPIQLTWVPNSFLSEHRVRPWSDMPAWIPNDPVSFVTVARSIQRGLTFRPLADTAEATLRYHLSRSPEERENLQAGMDPEREAEVLAAWHGR